MARIYATSCEKDTVPKKLQIQVRTIIESDGFVIEEDGTVVPAQE